MLNIERLIAFFIEGFFMTGASLSLIGIKLKIRKIITIASLYGISVFIIRKTYVAFKIPFGTHIVVVAIVLVLLIKIFGKQNIMISIISSLLSIILVLWAEGVFVMPVLKLFEIDYATLSAIKFGGTILGILISDILLIVGFLVGYIFNIHLINLSNLENTK